MLEHQGSVQEAKEKVKMEEKGPKEIRRENDVIYSPELVHTC